MSRILHLLSTLFLLALLSACAPRYDWRSYSTQEFSCLFPGKAARVARTVNLDGLAADMTQHAARVGDVAFVVGHVALPADNDAAVSSERILSTLRTAMLRNIAGEVVSEQSVNLPGAPGAAGIAAIELTANGQGHGESLVMRARFALQGGRAWQIVVLGPREELESPQGSEAVDTFFTSVRFHAVESAQGGKDPAAQSETIAR